MYMWVSCVSIHVRSVTTESRWGHFYFPPVWLCSCMHTGFLYWSKTLIPVSNVTRQIYLTHNLIKTIWHIWLLYSFPKYQVFPKYQNLLSICTRSHTNSCWYWKIPQYDLILFMYVLTTQGPNYQHTKQNIHRTVYRLHTTRLLRHVNHVHTQALSLTHKHTRVVDSDIHTKDNEGELVLEHTCDRCHHNREVSKICDCVCERERNCVSETGIR